MSLDHNDRAILKSFGITFAVCAALAVLISAWAMSAFDPPKRIERAATCTKDGQTFAGKAIFWRDRSGDDLASYTVRDGNGIRLTIDDTNSADWQCSYSG
ncbi:hypothetical protein UFOVP319_26 [uncultured Caudovirales phage]|uniref:Uncharacterized protein n=1 Tax=uncultured Caudovirales phage TaxID=2100421 RepID=A0A6J5LW64_9CAUD|nr:hypothetical protein UFOVP319_26 [uncultured Caudovirales phage]